MRPATCPGHPAAERQSSDLRASRLAAELLSSTAYKTTQLGSQHFDRIWEGDQNSMTQVLNFEAAFLRTQVKIQLEFTVLTGEWLFLSSTNQDSSLAFLKQVPSASLWVLFGHYFCSWVLLFHCILGVNFYFMYTRIKIYIHTHIKCTL